MLKNWDQCVFLKAKRSFWDELYTWKTPSAIKVKTTDDGPFASVSFFEANPPILASHQLVRHAKSICRHHRLRLAITTIVRSRHLIFCHSYLESRWAKRFQKKNPIKRLRGEEIFVLRLTRVSQSGRVSKNRSTRSTQKFMDRTFFEWQLNIPGTYSSVESIWKIVESKRWELILARANRQNYPLLDYRWFRIRD